MRTQKIKNLGKRKKEKLITYYEKIGGELYVTAPFSDYIIYTCRRWGGHWDREKRKWRVPPERLKNLIDLLGDQSLPLVRVCATESDLSGLNSQSHHVGLHILSYCAHPDGDISLYSDVIDGYAYAGGSRKYPKVISKDVVYAFWVPVDFAAKRNLQIISGNDYELNKAKELLETQLAELNETIKNQK